MITVAEHIARLGHSVTLYAREAGAAAEVARSRALRVITSSDDLPTSTDGVIAGVDRGLGLELATRYPKSARVFVVHSMEDVHLPPPVPGAFPATVALSDLHAIRAATCAYAGEVVRLRQPIDLRRFSPRGAPREQPRQVLLLGNYHSGPRGRAGVLRKAWADADLHWSEAGGASPTLDVSAAIAQADIVVGYGRSVLEAMACGRPAYIHEHSGSEGWVVPDTYTRMEAGGFAVAGVRAPPDMQRLRDDLAAYRAEWGAAGQDIVRVHHDARVHAAELIRLLERLGTGRPCGERSTLRALEHLAESQLRAEVMAEHGRLDAQRWSALYNELQAEVARERESWRTERAAWQAEREENMAVRADLAQDRATWECVASRAEGRVAAFRLTRRYHMAQALATPIDWLRRVVKSQILPRSTWRRRRESSREVPANDD